MAALRRMVRVTQRVMMLGVITTCAWGIGPVSVAQSGLPVVADGADQSIEGAAGPEADYVNAFLARALEIGDELEHPLVRSLIYCEIGRVQLEADDSTGAQITLSLALKAASNIGGPEASRKPDAYLSIAEVQAGMDGNAAVVQEVLRLALKAAEEMDDRWTGEKVRAYLSIAERFAAVEDHAGRTEAFEHACEAAGKIESAIKRSFAYTAIGGSQARTGDEAGAKTTFDFAIQAASETERIGHDEVAYGMIAAAQAEVGDLTGAFETLEKIKDELAKREAHLGIARIAAAQAEAGNMTFAFDAMERIEGEMAQTEVYRGVAIGQAKSGDIASAIETAGTLPEYYKDTAYPEIALAQAEAGDIAGALHMASWITHAGYRCIAYVNIAGVQHKVSDDSDAAQTLDLALEAAREIDRPLKRVNRLRRIATVAAELGNSELAGRTFELALDNLDEVELESTKESLRKAIAVEQAEAGDVDGALRSIAGLQRQDSATCRTIARAWAEAGDIAAVEGWLMELKDPVVRTFGYLGAAEGLMKQCSLRRANQAKQ